MHLCQDEVRQLMLVVPYLQHAWMWVRIHVAPRIFWFLLALVSCTTVPSFANTKVQPFERGIYDDCLVDGGTTCLRCYSFEQHTYCVLIERR